MAKQMAHRARRLGSNYPPLAMAGLMLLILLTVLPSALDLPQANPSETLEYAPVPPEDEAVDDPPPGNLSSLGLAASGSLGAGAGGTGEGLGGGGEPDLSGLGKNPSTKRCVGNPPRQTEDLASPPCVAYFAGNNFGSTYQGVTADEIRILLFSDRLGDPNEQSNFYYDLAKEPTTTEPVMVTEFRRFQRYFNERYQTYNRFVHFYAYYGTQGATSPEQRRTDAIANYSDLKPFAVVTSSSIGGNEDAYTSLLARRGVLNFGSAGMRASEFYDRHARMLWGYQPSVENHAASFSSYACGQVVGRPVVDSGNVGENGGPRRLGLLRTTDKGRPDLIALGHLIREQMKACGAEFVAERTFPVTGRVFQTRQEDGAASYASSNMAEFAREGVTTIIQAGGFETDQSKAAGAINYKPEWIMAGDGQVEGPWAGRYQNQDVWSHAWLVASAPRVGGPGHDPCRDVQQEADPDADMSLDAACTFSWYEGIRQLFTAIQVAGPRLNPSRIDQGFRAIPAKSSTSPFLAACFYPAGDYTCVKDAFRAWWDPGGTNDPNQTPGCYRMIEEGRRYLTGTWPPANIDARRTTTDPCNELATNFYGF